MTPEGKVKVKIKELLKRYGAWYCMPVGGPFGQSGIPDFLICFRGRFLAVEAKAGNNGPTDLQQAQFLNIADAGGTAMVINETNLHMLENWLAAHK